MTNQSDSIRFKVHTNEIRTVYRGKNYRTSLLKTSTINKGVQAFSIFENAKIEQSIHFRSGSKFTQGSGTISKVIKEELSEIMPVQTDRDLHWLFKYKEFYNSIQILGKSNITKKQLSELIDFPENEIGSSECNIEGRVKEICIILDISNNTGLNSYIKNTKEITDSNMRIPIYKAYVRYDKSFNYGCTLLKGCSPGYITNLKRKRLIKIDTRTHQEVMEFMEAKLFVRNQYETNHLSCTPKNLFKLIEYAKIHKISIKIYQNNKRRIYIPVLLDLLQHERAGEIFEKIMKAERLGNNSIDYYDETILFSSKEIDKIRDKILDVFLEAKDTNFIKLLHKASAISKEDLIETKFKLLKKEGFQGVLYPQQIQGYNWITSLYNKKIPGCILADDMGAGKTVQAIAFLSNSSLRNKKISIICPASVVGVWENEILKFNPIMAKRINRGISIQSFEKALNNPINSDIIVVDESQRFKNRKTEGFKKLASVKAEFILMLSGTPIENSLQDLFSLLELIDDSSTIVYRTLKKVTEDEFQLAPKIKRIIDPILLQRKKSKEQLDVKLIIKNVHVKATETEKILYKEIKEIFSNNLLQLQAKNNHDFYAISQAFVGLTRLRQSISLSNQLPPELSSHFSKRLDNFSIKLPSKFIECKKILKEISLRKEKTIIFTLFTKTRTFLTKKLKEQGYKVLSFGGSDSSQKRKDLIKKFQEDETYDIFIISLKSGNSGITLTAANNIIMYDLWWNSAVDSQAFARAHRIGQTKDVTAYRLITQDTIDTLIDGINQRKKDLIDNFNDNKLEGDQSMKELVMDMFQMKR